MQHDLVPGVAGLSPNVMSTDPASKESRDQYILGWRLWGNHGFNKDMISVAVA